ncbi:hypothetical protein ONZ45_g9083 [Pleurotus djamor]|nr:hypothetical protein ONZ45_g9083 [Pleurotus djamor]
MASSTSTTSSLLETRQNVTRGLGKVVDGIMTKGEGSYVDMHDGRRILDFSSGIGVTNLGHCHPKVSKAAADQCMNIVHAQCGIAFHEPYLRLIQKLLPMMPHKSLDSFFFWNSGSEAVEAAIKMARTITGRQNIITMQGAYHGRTFGAMAVTKSKTVYSQGFMPLMPGVFTTPFPYWHQWNVPPSTPTSKLTRDSLYQLDLLLSQQTTPKDTAAILVEPVIGEGGYVPAPAEFLQGLRNICDQHGILLIIDEVQSGFGRTAGKGKESGFFAIQESGVKPDILVIAKGLANGFPLSGVASRQELTDKLLPGSMGGTYAGNAVSCAAACAVADAMHEENVLDNVKPRSEQLFSFLNSLKAEYPSLITDVRGRGLMVAIEFASPGSSYDATNPGFVPEKIASQVAAKCIEKNLLILTTSVYETIRFIPPLNISEEDLAKGCEIFKEAVKEVLGPVAAVGLDALEASHYKRQTISSFSELKELHQKVIQSNGRIAPLVRELNVVLHKSSYSPRGVRIYDDALSSSIPDTLKLFTELETLTIGYISAQSFTPLRLPKLTSFSWDGDFDTDEDMTPFARFLEAHPKIEKLHVPRVCDFPELTSQVLPHLKDLTVWAPLATNLLPHWNITGLGVMRADASELPADVAERALPKIQRFIAYDEAYPDEFMEFASRLPNLQHLVFAPDEHQALEEMRDLASKLKDNKKLEYFNLWCGQECDNDGNQAEPEPIMRDIMDAIPSLRVLDFYRHTDPDRIFTRMYADASKPCKKLELPSLSRFWTVDPEVQELVSKDAAVSEQPSPSTPSLENKDESPYEAVVISSLAELKELRQQIVETDGRVASLVRHFDVGFDTSIYKDEPDTLVDTLKRLTQLQSLSISSIPIEYFANLRFPQLSKLSWSHSGAADEDKALFKAFLEAHPTIERLSSYYISLPQLSEKALPRLQQLIVPYPSTDTLLPHWNITHFGIMMPPRVGEPVDTPDHVFASVQHLSGFDESWAEELLQYARRFPDLRSLTFAPDECQFLEEFRTHAPLLKDNKKLEYLKIWCDQEYDDDANQADPEPVMRDIMNIIPSLRVLDFYRHTDSSHIFTRMYADPSKPCKKLPVRDDAWWDLDPELQQVLPKDF